MHESLNLQFFKTRRTPDNVLAVGTIVQHLHGAGCTTSDSDDMGLSGQSAHHAADQVGLCFGLALGPSSTFEEEAIEVVLTPEAYEKESNTPSLANSRAYSLFRTTWCPMSFTTSGNMWWKIT